MMLLVMLLVLLLLGDGDVSDACGAVAAPPGGLSGSPGGPLG